MSTTNTEKPQVAAGNDYFQSLMQDILVKLKNDPSSITTEDARRLSENAVVGDLRTAKIISAVEAFAVASETINEVDPQLGQAPHTSLLTVVNDLKVAVDQNPTDVTAEVLKKAQTVVSSKYTTYRFDMAGQLFKHTDHVTEMQRVVGHSNAPHPELEAQLKEEIAKIEPKDVEGTVTIEEANHLHSLEARAHGHTEKGGITSVAQSVAAKRERQLSLSSGSGLIQSRARANSKTVSSQEQSYPNLREAEIAVQPEVLQRTVNDEDPSPLHSREALAHDHTDKNDLSASAHSPTASKRQASLSDQTNVAQKDRDVNSKLAGMTLEPNNSSENVVQEGSTSPVKKDVAAAKPVGSMHKRQSSHTVEVN
jgi:hypothetical protein